MQRSHQISARVVRPSGASLMHTDHEYVGCFIDRLLAEDRADVWLRMSDYELANAISLLHKRVFSKRDPKFAAHKKLFGKTKPPPSAVAVRRALKVTIPLPDIYWLRQQQAHTAATRAEQLDPLQSILDEVEDPDERWH
jgi:hypothetical protein